jgi:hypothetical protein
MPMMNGYVTTFDSVLGKTDFELERDLGYNRGALAGGFEIYALSEQVSRGDFYWRDKTRYSAGMHGDPSVKFGSDPDVVWLIPRQDELRAALGKKYNYDERTVDAAIGEILDESLKLLNQRTGLKKIVKVRPLTRPTSYPNAESGNIPQWELKKEKQFTLIGTYRHRVPSH